MKRRLVFLLLIVALWIIYLFTSCGGFKKSIAKKEAISTSTAVIVGVDAKSETQTLHFGGHLKGELPLSVLVNDADSVVIEGRGQPLRLKSSGGKLHFAATALPTSIINTKNETHVKADGTASHNQKNTQAESDARFSWSPPWWVWLLGTMIVVLMVFGKAILKLLKPF